MIGKQFVAQKITTIGSSGIRRIFDLAASMTDPIDMSMGQPDFDTPAGVKRAAIAAIEQGNNGYTVTHGLPALRTGIAAKLRAEFDWHPTILITSGVSGGLVLALMACLNPGDEVLIGDPYFVSYPHLVNLFGGKPVFVDLHDDFTWHPERFEAAITKRTKIILLNSPGNPTGVMARDRDYQAIAELAEKHDLLMVSDEIYNLLCYDGPSPSPVSYAPERTLLLRGFGKSYGMTGWRMGFAAGPEAVVSQMAKLQQYTFVCAPHMAQYGAIEALSTDVSQQVANYRRKRNLAVSALEGVFEFVRPAGGFYVFPKAPPAFENSTAFVEKAIANNVLVIPGNAFSTRDTHFRISYALPDEKLVKGCQILCSVAKG
ncbi:MAG TPA: aminotransferase class I/II-fold pyridoxal phosphate-dependent enzyme [Phycisphaerae bacterium]|nr:aminotransferase class I/II-fold pyridoxal phosphate-dependent enzyme [Phycisphaerae bacterium]